VLVAAAAVCCSSYGGVSEGGAGDAASDVAIQLDCPLACAAPAPPGWTGPSAVFDDTTPDGGLPGCPQEYPALELEAYDGLDAGTPLCSCGGGAVSNASCAFDVLFYDAGLCTAAPSRKSSYVVTAGAGLDAACAPYVVEQAYEVTTPVLDAGTCFFPDASAIVPPSGLGRSTVACALPRLASCEARPECVAAPSPGAPFGRICIHRDGESDCPNANYPARFVSYRTVDDHRACSPCLGSTLPPPACGTMWITGTSCDSEGFVGENGFGRCNETNPSSSSLQLNGLGPPAQTCTQDGGGLPTGDAGLTGPVTFCCAR
jgi:hypothetical protein